MTAGREHAPGRLREAADELGSVTDTLVSAVELDTQLGALHL
jgi:hypothetical protein